MTFSDLVADVDFYCGSTSATYSVANKTRNINKAYQQVATLIWQSDGTWNYDDANNTDSPIAYRTLGNLSATYLIPTNAIRLRQIEVKDSSGNWSIVKPITYDDLTTSPTEFLTGGGLPLYYILDGTQISFYPAPTSAYVTLASGMAVRLSREVTNFATTASTATPGFPAAFHPILSYAASIDFVQDKGQRDFLMLQKDRLEKNLVRFYQGRSDDHPQRIKMESKKYWNQYT